MYVDVHNCKFTVLQERKDLVAVCLETLMRRLHLFILIVYQLFTPAVHQLFNCAL